MKGNLILILLVFSLNSVMAVSPRIKGMIRDKSTGYPIEFADVIVLKKGETAAVSSTLSGTDGSFRLADINDEEYSLLVRLIGYDVYTRETIALRPSQPVLDLGIIELQPLAVGLSEVVVVGTIRKIIY